MNPIKLKVSGKALVWALVGSVLLHGLFFVLVQLVLQPDRWFASPRESRLAVRLGHPDSAPASVGARQLNPALANDGKLGQANDPSSGEYRSVVEAPALPASPEGADEVYLPSEYVTQSAVPESEIDLGEIVSPNHGQFRMYIWINSHGDVAKIDLEESDTPSWLSEAVSDIFLNAHFIPARRDDQPVASIMHIEVAY